MKMLTGSGATLLILCLMSPGASAQQMPPMFGHLHPKLGAWAEYDVVHSDARGTHKAHMRIALVGKEDNAYWVETNMTIDTGKYGTMEMGSKALVSTEPSQVKRLIMKSPMGLREVATTSMPPPAGHGDMKEGGHESVTVPAGTFSTRILNIDDGSVTAKSWVKEGIGPWGIVKSHVTPKDGGESTMTLTAYGDGATSQIDETQAQPANAMQSAPSGGPGSPGWRPPPGGMTPEQIQELRQRAEQMRQQYQQQQ